jgi:hypothetical protein
MPKEQRKATVSRSRDGNGGRKWVEDEHGIMALTRDNFLHHLRSVTRRLNDETRPLKRGR